MFIGGSNAFSRFKLRQTGNVKKLIRTVFSRDGWGAAGQGWEGVEDRLQLTGWTRKRRVLVLRRKLKPEIALEDNGATVGTAQLQFIETEEGVVQYKYIVLITSLADSIDVIAQHYRDRGDAENIYDETKNQWGWGGYTPHDLKRGQIMARPGLIPNTITLCVPAAPLIARASTKKGARLQMFR